MGSSNSSPTDLTAQVLQQQQRELAAQLRAAQQQANQYEFTNLGLLSQQLASQSNTEAAVAQQLQGLLASGAAARTAYTNILGDLGTLQGQQYGINQQRTAMERAYSDQEYMASAGLLGMVQNRTKLLEAQEQQAMLAFRDAPLRAKNRAQAAYGNYRVGSLQSFSPYRI